MEDLPQEIRYGLLGGRITPSQWNFKFKTPARIGGTSIANIRNIMTAHKVTDTHNCGFNRYHRISISCFKGDDPHMNWCPYIVDGLPCGERAAHRDRYCDKHIKPAYSEGRDKMEALIAQGNIALPYREPEPESERGQQPAPVRETKKQKLLRKKADRKARTEAENKAMGWGRYFTGN